MRQLNLDQIRALIEVVECGSFTAAAQRLHLTQPAVSLQIQELETRFDVNLVERVGRRVRATPAGRELVEMGHKLLEQAAEAHRVMRRFSKGYLGQVRLGMSMTALIYLMPPVIRDLKASAPSIELVIMTSFSESIRQSVRDNEIDIGLCIGSLPDKVLEETKVGSDQLVAIFPADAPDIPAVVTPGQVIERWPIILGNKRSALRALVEGWIGKGGDIPKPIMELDNVAGIKSVVGAGIGMSIIPSLAIAGERLDPSIRVRPLAPAVHRQMFLVQRKDKAEDPAIQQVKAALLRNVQLEDAPSERV